MQLLGVILLLVAPASCRENELFHKWCQIETQYSQHALHGVVVFFSLTGGRKKGVIFCSSPSLTLLRSMQMEDGDVVKNLD